MANSEIPNLRKLDVICNEFEESWSPTRKANFGLYLAKVEEQLRDQLLEILLEVDVELRLKNNQAVDPHDYYELGSKAVEFVLQLTEFTATLNAGGQRDVVLGVEEESSRIGDYQILSEVARGGMGIVYRARQSKLDRVVALKVIKSGTFASKEEVNRFFNEAEAAARLKHSNIVPVYDVGQFESGHYLSMAFVEGVTLQERLQREPLDNLTAAEMIKQVADAIHYAHKQKILHRDLKPQNILLDRKSIPMITDFGLAKIMEKDSDLTHTGQVLGTPSYMAPEQASGNVQLTDKHTDVYALGGLLYASLTGRPPFQSANITETLKQVIEKDPVPPRQLNPAIDRDLETICLTCLEKEPERRYHSAREVANELERFVNGIPIQARPVGKLAKGWRWCRRNPVVSAFAFLAIALMINLAILGPIYFWRYNRLAEREQINREAAASALQQANDAAQLAERRLKTLEQQKLEVEKREQAMAMVDQSIKENNSSIAKQKSFLELLAIESSYERGEYARLRELVEQMGTASIDFREPPDTFLHRYWKRVANPPKVFSSSSLSSVAVSRDGSHIAMGSDEGKISVHQTSGERSRVYSRAVSDRPITFLFWCDDSTTLFAIDEAGDVYLTTDSDAQKLVTAPKEDDEVVCASLAPDASLLGVVFKSQPRILNIWNRKEETVVNINLENDVSDIFLGVSNGQILVLHRDGNLRLYDYNNSDFENRKTANDIARLNEGANAKIHASANLELIAIIKSKEIVVYRADSFTPTTLSIDNVGTLTSVAVLDSDRIAIGNAAGKIVIYNLADKYVDQEIVGYGYIMQLSSSANGQALAAYCASTFQRYAMVGDINEFCHQLALEVEAPDRVEFCSDPSVSQKQQGVIRAKGKWWTIDFDHRKLVERQALKSPSWVNFKDQLSRRYRYRILNEKNHISVFDRERDQTLELVGHESKPKKMSISHESSRMISVDDIGNLYVWDLEKGKILFNRKMPNAPQWMCISPNGKLFAWLKDSNSQVALYELNEMGHLSDKPIQEYRLGKYVVFSEDSKYLIVIDPHHLEFSRIIDSNEVEKIRAEEDDPNLIDALESFKNAESRQRRLRSGLFPTAVDASPDGKLVAIGTRIGKVQLWLIESAQLVATFNAGNDSISQVKFSPDGNLLVAISRSGNRIKVWSAYQ